MFQNCQWRNSNTSYTSWVTHQKQWCALVNLNFFSIWCIVLAFTLLQSQSLLLPFLLILVCVLSEMNPFFLHSILKTSLLNVKIIPVMRLIQAHCKKKKNDNQLCLREHSYLINNCQHYLYSCRVLGCIYIFNI